MPLVKRPPGNAISFDALPTSIHSCEERVQNPPLDIPEFPPLEIVSIEDLPEEAGATGVAASDL